MSSNTPLGVIESFGAPTDSYLAAINYFRYDRYTGENNSKLSQEKMEQGIADIIGVDIPPHFNDARIAEYHFLYTVQETVRAFLGPEIPDMADIWELVQQRTDAFIENNPWVLIDFNEIKKENTEPKLDATGNPKMKKGAKKVLAEEIYHRLNDGNSTRIEIINLLIEEAQMTKAGATTYFHDLKKVHGFHGPKPEKKPKKKIVSVEPTQKKVKKRSGPSKVQIAKEVYIEMKGKPKPEIIEEIVKRSKTTPMGANTYFCACKKELGV